MSERTDQQPAEPTIYRFSMPATIEGHSGELVIEAQSFDDLSRALACSRRDTRENESIAALKQTIQMQQDQMQRLEEQIQRLEESQSRQKTRYLNVIRSLLDERQKG